MKVTKYPQSCLLVETATARLLIDPGSFAVNVCEPSIFGRLDAVLYTHRHGDHYDERFVSIFADHGTRFITNTDVAKLLVGRNVTVLDDGAEVAINGSTVQSFNLPHFPMVDGSAGPPNSGFLIDRTFLHPGDGVHLPFRVDNLAVPIAGPSVSFRDAYAMVKEAQATHAIPMHYDAYIAKPEQFADACDIATVVVLDVGQTVSLL